MSRRLPHLLLALLLAGPGALVAAPPARGEGEDLDALLEQLASEDASERYAAYNALRTRRDDGLATRLGRLVPDMPPAGRPYAFYLLDQLDADEVERVMARLVRADDPYARLAAAAWLVRHGEERHAHVLGEALGAEGLDDSTYLWMISRLYAVQHPAATEAVRRLVVPGTPPTVLASALGLLCARDDAPTATACRVLLAEEDDGIRALAGAALLRLGHPEGGSPLARALAAGVTSTIWYRVESLLGQATHVPAEVLDAVATRLAGETSPTVLARMIDLLARFGHVAARSTIARLVDHEDDDVARAAFDALAGGSLGGLEGDALVTMLETGSPRRRLWAAEALRRRDDLRGLPVALAGVAHEDAAVRAEAAAVLGGFREDRAADRLLEALEDEDAAVRQAAWLALAPVLRGLLPYRRLDLGRTGYDPAAPAGARAAGLARLRTWWEAERDRGW